MPVFGFQAMQLLRQLTFRPPNASVLQPWIVLACPALASIRPALPSTSRLPHQTSQRQRHLNSTATMASTDTTLRAFFQAPKYAVVGASTNTEKFGYKGTVEMPPYRVCRVTSGFHRNTRHPLSPSAAFYHALDLARSLTLSHSWPCGDRDMLTCRPVQQSSRGMFTTTCP